MDRDRDMLAELEAWQSEHKAHAVHIEHANGYGAAWWIVTLWDQRGAHVTAEPEAAQRDADGWFDDWPGLAKTIALALERVRALPGAERVESARSAREPHAPG